MAIPALGSARTELADMSRLDDLHTQSSLPSPVKRQPNQTPNRRNVLADRRNIPTKNEFTPLLKSATKNRMLFSRTKGKENGLPATPAALKPGFQSYTPGLPLSSSIILEEQTGSSLDVNDEIATSLPPVASSSAISTPIAPRQNSGPLDSGRNLASLREQEAVSIPLGQIFELG